MAMRYLENGGVLEEAKLVNKRALRKWKDEEAAEEFMKKHGVDPWAPRKLVSPAQAEKRLPKQMKHMAWASTALTPDTLVDKPPAGLTITGKDDPRPAQIPQKARAEASLAAVRARKLLGKAAK